MEVTLYNSKGRRVGKTQKLNSYAYSAYFDKMKDEVYTVTIQAFKTVRKDLCYTEGKDSVFQPGTYQRDKHQGKKRQPELPVGKSRRSKRI